MSLLGKVAVITIGAALASNYHSTFANAESTAVKLGDAYKKTQAKLSVSSSIGKYEKQIGALDARYKAGLVTTDIYSKIHAKLQNQLFSTRGEATKLGVALEGLGKTQQHLLTLRGKYQETRIAGLGMYNSAKEGMKQQWVGAAGAIGSAAIPIKLAADFEQSMSKVKALVGATDTEFNALTDTARKLGSSTVFSSTEAASGMFFLSQQGFKTNQIIGAMPGMLDLAAAGGTELGETADIAGAILNSFNLKAEQMTHVSDVLAKTFTSSATNLRELGEAMSYAGPVAAGLNVSLEETSAFMGVLANAGIKGSMAGTTFRSVMLSLTDDSSEGADMLREMGVEARDLDGNLRPLGEIMADLSNAIADKGTAEKGAILNAIFGERAVTGMMKVMSKGGVETLKQFTKELNNVDGVGKKIAAVNMDNFWGSVEQLKGGLEDLGITIGNVLIPPLRLFVDTITFILEPIGNFAKENTLITTTVVWFAATLLMLTKVFPLVSLGIKMITGAIMANPIGLAIGLIVIGLSLIIRYWEPIVGFFGWLWNGVVSIFGFAWTSIKWYITNLTPLGLIIKNWEPIKSVLVEIFEWVKLLFLNFTPLGLIIKNWGPIKSFFIGWLDGIKAVFGYVWEAIKWSFIEPVKPIIENWSPIKLFFTGLWDEIIGGAIDAFGWILSKLEFIGQAWGKLKSIFSIGSMVEKSRESRLALENKLNGGSTYTEEQAEALAKRTQASSPAMAASRINSQKVIHNSPSITINAQPGQDEEMIANLAVKRIQEYNEQQQQGALYDHELSFA